MIECFQCQQYMDIRAGYTQSYLCQTQRTLPIYITEAPPGVLSQVELHMPFAIVSNTRLPTFVMAACCLKPMVTGCMAHETEQFRLNQWQHQQTIWQSKWFRSAIFIPAQDQHKTPMYVGVVHLVIGRIWLPNNHECNRSRKSSIESVLSAMQGSES